MLLQQVLPGLSFDQEAFRLRPYQQDCVQAILYAYFYCDRSKGMIEMPTGAGKTVTALHTLYRLREVDRQTTALFIAPTIDLALKNCQEARRFFPHEEVGLVQAEHRHYQHPIVVATTDTLANPQTRRKLLLAQGLRKFSFVWIDESHTRVLGTLQEILLDLEDPHALRLGVSATPYCDDGRSLLPAFPDGFFYRIELSALVADDYLLPFQVHQIKTTEESRPKSALAAWREIIGEEPTIVFARSVSHAHEFNRYFRMNKVRSAVVSHKTQSERRIQIYREFCHRITPVMHNFGVLTTGVDFPEACAAIIARDAWMKGKLSRVHRQAVGRIIRLCQEKHVGRIVYLTTPECDWVPDLEVLPQSSR
jgi:superfamily II DNA or RNA helicase